ncbi:helix-turn-helix transcriptional regulator [Paenibacillus tarimensis]
MVNPIIFRSPHNLLMFLAIENNKYDPTLKLAFKLAKVLGTSVDDLFIKD